MAISISEWQVRRNAVLMSQNEFIGSGGANE